MQVVDILMSEGPATPSEIAERAGLTKGGSITSVLDRLERLGYVVRERDLTDRRRVIVTAVPEKVMAAVGHIDERVTARWSEYLVTVTDEQLAFANELLATAASINREETDRLARDPSEA